MYLPYQQTLNANIKFTGLFIFVCLQYIKVQSRHITLPRLKLFYEYPAKALFFALFQFDVFFAEQTVKLFVEAVVVADE